jgi:hypothetical protein
MAKIPDEALEYFRREGSRGGKKSAAGRLKKMTPEQRSEVARTAAAASAKVRTAKAAKKKGGPQKPGRKVDSRTPFSYNGGIWTKI